MELHAQWLGTPDSDGYELRETQAMLVETEATNEAMDMCLAAGNAVLDTPGSVIYIDADSLARLKQEFFLVYLLANDDNIARLIELYISHPKPLIWNGYFKYNENMQNSLIESYPKLLRSRSKIYAELADITIEAQKLYEGDITPQNALGL